MTDISVRVIDCWVFRRTENGLRFLIMKRSPERIYDGIYHCVHGKIKKGEPAWKAALRELQEETGITPLRLWTADIVSSFYEAAFDRMNLVPVFAAEASGPAVQLSSEHSDYLWLSPEDAAAKTAWRNHRDSILAIADMMRNDFVHKKWLEVPLDA